MANCQYFYELIACFYEAEKNFYRQLEENQKRKENFTNENCRTLRNIDKLYR